ncbi:MAG TPA: hypothetical protein VLW52_05115 [Opitutaceae bacterium]|nr:hypothetical protein [Opitutaceae bacterium]
MTYRFLRRTAGLLGLQALCVPLCHAALMGYTNQSDFLTAISSGYSAPHVTNFESVAGGTIIPSGTTVEGTTFTYSLGTDANGNPVQMQVGPATDFSFDTTSSPNYLGTTADGGFLSGDQFTMTFAQPVLAVGLFVISGGSNLDGDYTLSITQGSVGSSALTDSTFGTLGDGGNVYFLGLVESDPSKTFTSAAFSSVGGLGVPFNVDDITTAAAAASNPVPDEASTCGLLLVTFAGLIALRRRLS